MSKSTKSAVVEVSEVSLDDQLNGLTTKSAKIRLLDVQGFTRSQIATKLGIRYQHVRNVLITPLTTKV